MKLNREKAIELLDNYLTSEHLHRHSYAVESVMRELSKRLEPENEELWALTGLLHDLDADLMECKNDPALHGKKTIEILSENEFGCDSMYHAICAHNEDTGTKIDTKMDRAIYAADPITGFITAIALVYPDKKVNSVKVKSITKRMKELKFAAGANRDAMRSIEELGISFQEFAELSLNAMKQISDKLGL